jgi:hypothetical protein
VTRAGAFPNKEKGFAGNKMWAAELLLQSASHSSSVDMSEYNWESCSGDDKRCQCTT